MDQKTFSDQTALPPKLHDAAMRAVLFTAFFLVLGAGLDLFVFPELTATMFAWDIQPPITAAFLGANYLGAGVVEFGADRQRHWAGARCVVAAVMLFTVLTALLTLWNFSAYNLKNPMAWIWIIFYFGVPPALGLAWWKQCAAPGGEPPQEMPIPRALLSAMQLAGTAMIFLGLGLIFAWQWTSLLWPWSLASSGYGSGPDAMHTYIGVWLLAWGTVMLNAAMENDLARIRYIFTAFITLAVLQAIVVSRFAAAHNWSLPAVCYLAALVALASIGIWGWSAVRKATATDGISTNL